MNVRTLATSVVVASDFYVSYVALDMLTSLQRSLIFSTTIFVYLVVFYRKELPVLQTMNQPYRHANAMPQARQGATQQTGAITPEMRAINRYLNSRQIWIVVNSVTDSPDYYIYSLVKVGKISWSSLTKNVINDLAHVIYDQRGGGDPITVVFNEMPSFLRVTKKQRDVLPWSNRLSTLPSYVAQVGAALNGTELSLVKVNFSDPKEWLLGVFSSSGGGKSNILKAAALSVLENCDPSGTEFYFIDLDSNQFDSWLRLPHVRFVATEENEALALLDYLNRQIEGNRDLSNTKRRFLVVDELQMLTSRSDNADKFKEMLGTLAERWRKHGGNMLLSTQDPTGDNYPTALQRNTKVIMAGLTEDDSYLKKFLGVDGARTLRGDGDFIVKGAGRQTNFKGFMLAPDDIAKTLDSIVKRWGEDYSTLAFEQDEQQEKSGFFIGADEHKISNPTNVLRMPETKIKKSRAQIDADIIAPYLDEAYDIEAGCLRDGWAPTLLELLYGEPKRNTGGYSTRLTDAIKCALNNNVS